MRVGIIDRGLKNTYKGLKHFFVSNPWIFKAGLKNTNKGLKLPTTPSFFASAIRLKNTYKGLKLLRRLRELGYVAPIEEYL